MARRPTISDLAREAGVSPATVDRVLNGRERVRRETAQRVYAAANRIGYHGVRLIEQRLQVDLPECRLGFVLQKQRQSFYQSFGEHLERAVQALPDVRGRFVLEYCPTQTPSDIADMMLQVGRQVDVLAAVAVNHQVTSAAVNELKAAGVPTFSLLSDFAQGERANYVGLNNLKMGRVAASMLAMAVHAPGKIAIFVGGHRWHGHDLRETGFRTYFREFHPNFTVLDTLVNLETRQLTHEATLDLLERHPDLKGIYVAGGGMEGAISALREVRAPGDVALVVNELTPESRAALSDRYALMAIGTPLDELSRDLASLMVESVRGSSSEGLPGQRFLQPRLCLPESL
ncbi:LacI family DNA-binding transcriptional regulator [Roseibium salinum]|uniref:LacI family DNA-binding transcriptional regulator n=1 Tax=Roseibium salinum TaxID=1604349 RepID=A0ABT3QWC9_9HYPH|nr:LacI family DNA-binding transcriptional regulator [Roseibium sp. DSM 29163]MCX2721207.1 LacI family DNA-binding transcriptional regulator [Roseibium sp. DSM 29163]MDN3722679.1 LacI family DNA-binding transcriptional regulator [Roseibium salinum]